jgi:thiamine-phosphate pyrophosphorylase
MTNIDGIYGILPSGLSTELLLQQAEAAMRGGVRVLQYRNKQPGFHRARKQAKALRALCRDYQTMFMVNDSIPLALACEADGVHLGREDAMDLTQVRRDIGNHLCMGITCRADAALAKHALACGADYLSFGAVFASSTKADVPVIGLPRLQRARQMFPDATICAIGGIDASRLEAVKACGVNAAAVISSLFTAEDIEQQARLMVSAWQK